MRTVSMQPDTTAADDATYPYAVPLFDERWQLVGNALKVLKLVSSEAEIVPSQQIAAALVIGVSPVFAQRER